MVKGKGSSEFIESVNLTLKDLADDLKTTLSNPDRMLSSYSLVSMPLSVIYVICGAISSKADEKDEVMGSEGYNVPETRSNRGSFIAHLVLFFCIYVIDQFKYCSSKGFSTPNFEVIVKDGLVTVLPVWCISMLLGRFLDLFDVYVAAPDMVTNFFEGCILFLLYNWASNFRKMHGYDSCKVVTDIQIEQSVYNKQLDSILQDKYQPISGYNSGNNPTTDSAVITTTIVSTSGGVIPVNLTAKNALQAPDLSDKNIKSTETAQIKRISEKNVAKVIGKSQAQKEIDKSPLQQYKNTKSAKTWLTNLIIAIFLLFLVIFVLWKKKHIVKDGKGKKLDSESLESYSSDNVGKETIKTQSRKNDESHSAVFVSSNADNESKSHPNTFDEVSNDNNDL